MEALPRQSGTVLLERNTNLADAREPLLLTSLLSHFIVDASAWHPRALERRFPTTTWDLGLASGERTTLSNFARMSASSTSPDYVFDERFGGTSLASEYLVPPLFPTHAEASYSHFVSSMEALRPAWRWLLMGAPGSGFGLHVDPHDTSAWNLLIRGRKRWCVISPDAPLELVLPSAGDEELRAEQWFSRVFPSLTERAAALGWHGRMYHFQQAPGEVVFVPRGWWHVVLNVTADEDGEEAAGDGLDALSVALTQNFMGPEGFKVALQRLAADAPQAAHAWCQRAAAAGLPEAVASLPNFSS